MKNKEKTLKSVAEELFSLMSVNAEIDCSYDKDNDTFNVNVQAEDTTGLLIGKKGETLASIQTILGILFKQKVGEWHRVVVNIGDYREKEEDYLKNLADSALARAKETGETQRLYNLNAWQRRVIHLYLSENPEVSTESEGEGEERCLAINLKG